MTSEFSDRINYHREFLYSRDNDSFSAFKCWLELFTSICDSLYESTSMIESTHCISELLIKHLTIRDDKDTIEYIRHSILHIESCKLMSEPSDRVTFTASCTMLYKVFLSCSFFLRILKELIYYCELMVARKYEFSDLFPSLFFDDDLSKIPYQLWEIWFRQDFFPHITCTESICDWRITCSLIVSSVEWKKPSLGIFHTSCHIYKLSIYCKMHKTSLKSEEFFTTISISFVLFDSIFYILSCEEIFEFQCRDRESIDEEHHIDRLVVLEAKK